MDTVYTCEDDEEKWRHLGIQLEQTRHNEIGGGKMNTMQGQGTIKIRQETH